MRRGSFLRSPRGPTPRHYKWIALSNTTLGVLMATINTSVVIISLPAIFRGIHLDPLAPGNVGYLLWTLLGYLVVTTVFVVAFGRLGDIYGRVKLYRLGFVVFTIGSILLALTPSRGTAGALEIIVFRLIQGIGGALLMANSTAILTDAFPAHQRGAALGLNQVAALAGSFIGLLVGGLLSPISFRAIFWISVPFGLFGSAWSYLQLREIGERTPARIDWLGNLLFAIGLVAILIATSYGIQPGKEGQLTSWTSPWLLSTLFFGIAVLILFLFVERRVREPMLDLSLFKIREFAAGNIALFLFSLARGGLQLILVIWLQGIWLPLHGVAYEKTPLRAALDMLPLTAGFLIAGPIAGHLSDKHGVRGFATVGLSMTAGSFLGLLLLPTLFDSAWMAFLLALNGIGSGLFAAPNTSAIMGSAPAAQRGAANGVRATLMNAGMVLSIGIFFSLLVVGIAEKLPNALQTGLTEHGLPSEEASRIAKTPPVASLFAAFLGENPLGELLSPELLSRLSKSVREVLTGPHFFPKALADPFHHGLSLVFWVAIALSIAATIASALRGRNGAN